MEVALITLITVLCCCSGTVNDQLHQLLEKLLVNLICLGAVPYDIVLVVPLRPGTIQCSTVLIITNSLDLVSKNRHLVQALR